MTFEVLMRITLVIKVRWDIMNGFTDTDDWWSGTRERRRAAIMVVAFIAFVGEYVKALFVRHLISGGSDGCNFGVWFTFLPSFIFILAGGPLVESAR